MNILDQDVPGLSERLERLLPEQWRPVLVSACQIASRSITDLEPEFKQLLATSAATHSLSAEEVARVRAYAEVSDERYFDAQEAGEEECIWLNWFAKARLATAVANAFGSDESDTAENAFYEVLHSINDKSDIRRLIETAILPTKPTASPKQKNWLGKLGDRFRRH
jgi:hypothetical protein